MSTTLEPAPVSERTPLRLCLRTAHVLNTNLLAGLTLRKHSAATIRQRRRNNATNK
ncbi:hypothetical protein GBF38_008559 [Nibea albiflora]|uniref:Uncharacterized protein n=1 Tax=Nibea albiflora TaxID=240163 RepID=A0ACB7EZI7_NIBAL|nr:hypothetical protein GBF38_008559 [Nibea albiflora]